MTPFCEKDANIKNYLFRNLVNTCKLTSVGEVNIYQ